LNGIKIEFGSTNLNEIMKISRKIQLVEDVFW
jgi:hypothetical protein